MAQQKRAPCCLLIAQWINECLAISRPENQVVFTVWASKASDLEDLVTYLKRDCEIDKGQQISFRYHCKFFSSIKICPTTRTGQIWWNTCVFVARWLLIAQWINECLAISHPENQVVFTVWASKASARSIWETFSGGFGRFGNVSQEGLLNR